MTDDPRLTDYLALAQVRPHPFYARQALRFAAQAGDTAAIAEAVRLGALDWRPEPCVYARTEEESTADLRAAVESRVLKPHRPMIEERFAVQVQQEAL